MPKKGWKKGPDGLFYPPEESRDKSRGSLAPEWSRRHGFQAFGDRLNFLSPEIQHLSTGRLSILPPKGEKAPSRPGSHLSSGGSDG